MARKTCKVAATLRRYLENNNIDDMFQSAYRPNHGCETATVKIFNDISLAVANKKKVVVLCLLDLSAAFDTLDHTILMQRLSDIGIKDNALAWFRSYLSGRVTAVKIGTSTSSPTNVKYGVPQGSVLGPALFNIYCLPLASIIRKNKVPYHMYADDTQLYVDCDATVSRTVPYNHWNHAFRR